MNNIELFHQTYTYDTGNNLTNLSHQANSGNWQQTLAIHPNNNRALYCVVLSALVSLLRVLL
jgi:insecticidal toxin complex protein TccC